MSGRTVILIWNIPIQRSVTQDRLFTPPVISLILLSFVLGISEFIIIGILPEMAVDLNVPIAMIGGLVSIFAASYVIGTLFLTSISSKYGMFKILMILMIAFFIGNSISLTSSDYLIMVISRVMTAAVSGTLLSLSMASAMMFTSPSYRSKTISWIYAGFSIASVIGVPVGTTICHMFGWRWTFVMILVLSVIVTIMMFITLPRKNGNTVKVNKKDATSLFSDRRIIAGMLIIILSITGTYGVCTYLTPIFEDMMGVSVDSLSAFLMIYGVSSIISNLLSSRVADQGGFKVLVVVFAIQSIALGILDSASKILILGVTTMFIIGVSMYLMNATNQIHFTGIAIKDYPSATNFASSLNPVSFNIGIALGSFIASLIVDNIGLYCLGYFGVITSLFAMLTTLYLVHLENHDKIATVDKKLKLGRSP